MIRRAFLIVLLTATQVFAAETSYQNNTTPGSFNHTHSYDDHEYENPAGVGLDVILYRPTFNTAVIGESRYDFNNEAFSLYGVFSVDLTNR